jgi:hypothetical protein
MFDVESAFYPVESAGRYANLFGFDHEAVDFGGTIGELVLEPFISE